MSLTKILVLAVASISYTVIRCSVVCNRCDAAVPLERVPMRWYDDAFNLCLRTQCSAIDIKTRLSFLTDALKMYSISYNSCYSSSKVPVKNSALFQPILDLFWRSSRWLSTTFSLVLPSPLENTPRSFIGKYSADRVVHQLNGCDRTSLEVPPTHSDWSMICL